MQTLKKGYAERSSRRHPRDPQTVVVGEREIAAARPVGYARIDGRLWLAFRARINGRPVYYFQTDSSLFGQ